MADFTGLQSQIPDFGLPRDGKTAPATGLARSPGKSSPHPPPSYSAKAEYPVRRGLSMSLPTPLEYWIVRSSRTTTGERAATSRGSRQTCRPHGLAALGPKISKTTPCKVAWRSLACAIPRQHLTRRANHLHYSIIAQSVERKRTWHQRRGARPTLRRRPQHRRSCCTPRPLTRVTSCCNLMPFTQAVRQNISSMNGP